MFQKLKFNSITQQIIKAILHTYFVRSFLVFVVIFKLFSYIFYPYTSNYDIDNKDLVNLFLTYNALVLSFTISSITLVIALPSKEFILFLAKERTSGDSTIVPFKNLILSFFQTAIAHYISLMCFSILFLFWKEKISIKSLVSLLDLPSIVIMFQAWAFILFGVALKDIASLGVLYANYLSKPHNHTTTDTK